MVVFGRRSEVDYEGLRRSTPTAARKVGKSGLKMPLLPTCSGVCRELKIRAAAILGF
jgi:hypothetical protein